MAVEDIPNQSPESNDPPAPTGGSIQKINVAEEIKNSFLDYSMSVIISRALPDVRDGLKPSQRRILYAMQQLSLYPGRKPYKCAKICGDTSGDYHPHGEAVIYPTLVHMAQPWAMREVLIEGQGNFGSVEGDPPAAMRYTEARMTHLGAALMTDMDKDTVDFVPNYDERLTEPTVFPAAFPNLLVNGGTGIAVGMATNIAPHNLGEVIDGIQAQIDNPAITILELMKFIKGPDFPTGCQICGVAGIQKYFETGRGSVKVRGKVEVELSDANREQLVIREIPYGVNRATLVERISQLVNEKVLTGITDIRDESDENTRVVIEIRRDAIARVIMNNLYKHTVLETSFSSNMLAIDHGRPKVLNLKEIIQCYIEHRREVVMRRTAFELRKAEARAEVLEGYLIALDNLDDFIRIIRESANREEAQQKLMRYEFSRETVEQLGILIRREVRLVNGQYKFSKAQADSVLELRLYQLTGLERDKVRGEYNSLLEKIRDLMDILQREERVLNIIKEELLTIREKYANPRKTSIVPDEGEIPIEDLIANEGVIITITHNGLIKRTSVNEYRAQKRGGKGVKGLSTRKKTVDGQSEDFLEHLFTAGAHDYLLFFTNTGRVFLERVYEIPEAARAATGRSIANLLNFRENEKVAALIRLEATFDEDRKDVTFRQDGYLFFVTRLGKVKKSLISDYANIRRDGINAVDINEGDDLIQVLNTSGSDSIVLITHEGMSIRYQEENVRPMGRNAAGVRGINLSGEDYVVAAAKVDMQAMLLVASENGIGKRSIFDEYRVQTRGGKGVRTMKTGDRTGKVVGAMTVHESDEIMLISSTGLMVRTKVSSIRVSGRVTSGVKLVDLDDATLVSMAPVIEDEESESLESPDEVSGDTQAVVGIPPSTADQDEEADSYEEDDSDDAEGEEE